MKVAVLYPFHVWFWSKIKGGEINKEMKTNLKDSKLQTNRQRSNFKQTQLTLRMKYNQKRKIRI
jgi:hypothetical protein